MDIIEIEEFNKRKKIERNKTFVSFFIPISHAILMGLVKLFEVASDTSFYMYGISPRTLIGLRGIFLAPFIHANWDHYLSNAVPLIMLGAACIYFYRFIAYKVLLTVWILDGAGVWLLGRDSYHIGASGIIYGLASFIFFSGVLRKNRSLLALSLIVIATYGGLIWGVLPYLKEISWEAHFYGLLSGIGLAIYYRHEGPQDDKLPDWFYEEEIKEIKTDENIILQKENINTEEENQIKINYNYKPNKED